MSLDGVLSVTTPSGVTRTTRPPGMGHGVDHRITAGLLTRDADPPPDDAQVPAAGPTCPVAEVDPEPPPF